MRPGDEVAAGVRLGVVESREVAVEVEPAGHPLRRRVPHHRGVVDVAYRDDATRARDPRHLAQGAHGVGEVLEHLVRMDDVEGPGGIRKGHDVGALEAGAFVTSRCSVAAGLLERAVDVLDPDHVARGADGLGEVEGDRAGPAADVEDRQPVVQVGEQVGRRVGGGPRPVRREDARVVTVEVDVRHGATLRLVRGANRDRPRTTKARPWNGAGLHRVR